MRGRKGSRRGPLDCVVSATGVTAASRAGPSLFAATGGTAMEFAAFALDFFEALATGWLCALTNGATHKASVSAATVFASVIVFALTPYRGRRGNRFDVR